jgi:prophage regulatory protein
MRVLRLKATEQKTGLKCASIYERMAAGTFPRPVKLGERAVGWIEHELDEWLAARIADRDQAVMPGPSPNRKRDDLVSVRLASERAGQVEEVDVQRSRRGEVREHRAAREDQAGG